jgi:methionine-S-sulfoxide reductase
MSLETATIAAGCFWGVEEAYRTLPGIITTEVGYTGGHTEGPTYEQVCEGTTGHAEALRITFDPEVISYGDLIKRFFAIHDATQMNRQGPDVGEQYRSAIFFHTPQQEKEARGIFAAIEKEKGTRLATKMEEAKAFYPAEDYHQKYFLKNGGGACHL